MINVPKGFLRKENHLNRTHFPISGLKRGTISSLLLVGLLLSFGSGSAAYAAQVNAAAITDANDIDRAPDMNEEPSTLTGLNMEYGTTTTASVSTRVTGASTPVNKVLAELTVEIEFKLDHSTGGNTCLDGATMTLSAIFASLTTYDLIFGFATTASASSHTLTIAGAPTTAGCNGGTGLDGTYTDPLGLAYNPAGTEGNFYDDTGLFSTHEFSVPGPSTFVLLLSLAPPSVLPGEGDFVDTSHFSTTVNDAGFGSIFELDGSGYALDPTAPPVITPDGGPTDGTDPAPANALEASIDGVNLVITEVGGDTADSLTISTDGDSLMITDANNTLGDGGITGGAVLYS